MTNLTKLIANHHKLTDEFYAHYEELLQYAIAGAKLAEAVWKMEGAMTAEGMPTLYSMRVMKVERDFAIAEYKKAIETL